MDWERFDDLRRWLRDDSRRIDDNQTFNQGLLDRLLACALPIDRITVAIPSLHPQFDSYTLRWTREEGFEARSVIFDTRVMALFERSPYQVVFGEGKISRTRIGPEPVEGEFGVIADLREVGMTDYVVLPLAFSDGTYKGLGFATRQPGGFTEEEMEAIEEFSLELTPCLEIRTLRLLAATLLQTYVGTLAGERVLQGKIKRGDGEHLRAAIWFSDLRGFTAMSEALRGPEMLDLLNDYLDLVTSAIEQEGGEVLKFIGDAVLAVFRSEEENDQAAAKSALRAAKAAEQTLAERNDERRARGAKPMRFGLALHLGDVYYGNVGGQSRLDFTVIGPSVNLASRIEGLSKELDRPILCSAEFAALHGGKFESLGSFSFKGISEKRAVYAPLD